MAIDRRAWLFLGLSAELLGLIVTANWMAQQWIGSDKTFLLIIAACVIWGIHFIYAAWRINRQ